MNTLFLDAIFPDPHDSSTLSTSKAQAGFTTGNPFALPSLYPPSILGNSTWPSPREANIFDVVDHKDSVKFAPKTAEEGDGGDSLLTTLDAGMKGGAARGGGVGARVSLFSLPEEFRSGVGDMWGVNHLTVGGEKIGGEAVGGSDAGPEGGHEGTEVSEEDISEVGVGGVGDNGYGLWLDPSVAIPLEKVSYMGLISPP
ncbi:hypothetical protein BGX38DRAFT_901881 [Terfezia claveryi]|nr:hypothetical protein BGX38DRAFT_901881 [Terfezia claveryi]